MLCRPFSDLSRAWLCYVGPLVTLAMFGYVCRPFGELPCLGMYGPFGDLSRAWLCYVGPLVTLAMFGYVMQALW